MHAYDVLVIGRSCLDFIAVVDRFPEENRKVPLALRLGEGGGQGGTAARRLAASAGWAEGLPMWAGSATMKKVGSASND